MEAKRIHEDITQILYKIEDQYGRIIKYKDSIPVIEVDLIQKDIQELYECFFDLRLLAESMRRKRMQAEIASENPAIVASPSQPEVKDEVTQPKVDSTISISLPAPEISEEATEIDLVVQEVEKEQHKEVEEKQDNEVEKEQHIEAEKELEDFKNEQSSDLAEENKKPVEIKEVKVDPIVASPTPTPIAWQKTFDASQGQIPPASSPVSPKVDLLKEREKDFVPTVRKIEFKPQNSTPETKKESLLDKAASLYDKIAKPSDKSPVNPAGRQPVSNIKSAIGINEKFTYLKELFKNNVAEYNEALDKLNDFENYADAEDCFQELKEKYNWDPESKSFQGLADLLYRRYLHNAG
jgi:hypothetical protein